MVGAVPSNVCSRAEEDRAAGGKEGSQRKTGEDEGVAPLCRVSARDQRRVPADLPEMEKEVCT